MALETALGELIKEDQIDANKILHELLDQKNIDMKTHINDPITFAILESFIYIINDMLKDIKKSGTRLPITEKFLKSFLAQLKKFLVSWDRQSRKEITETLQAIKQENSNERSLFQRLTGFGRS